MVRVSAVLCCVLWLTSVMAADRAAILLNAKTEFLKQSASARTAYLQAVDAHTQALDAAGDRAGALRMRTHRGTWLLGDITAEEYRAFEADSIPPDHLPAVDACIETQGACRQALADAYQQIIDEAQFIKRDDEATAYQQEFDAFQNGDYVPTAVEVIKPRPYDVRRVVLDPPLIMSATATKIPDELFVDFRDAHFSISGTKRIDSANVDGKSAEDFGKGVVFTLKNQGPQSFRGYLMIGALEEDANYTIITANRTKLTPVVSLNDLELDTVYEWSVESARDSFRIEVRHDGDVIKSERAVGGNGYAFGFCATLRHADTQSRLVVAVE